MIFLLFVAVLLPAVIISASLYYWKRITERFDQIDGPKPLPIIGNALQFDQNPHLFYMQVMDFAATYGRRGLFRFWLGTTPRILLTSPYYIEKLLHSNTQLTKAYDYEFLHPWLGTGLLTSTNNKWKRNRKLLTPTFHFKILEDFLTVFNEQAMILNEYLDMRADTGEIFDIYPLITRCALDIICETAMGEKVNSQQNDESTYVKAIARTGELLQQRQKSPWLWPDIIYNFTSRGKDAKKHLDILHSFTNQVIQKRRAVLESRSNDEMVRDDGIKRKLAFLDMMLQNSYEFSDENIREEVDTFMFEGHDTTSTAMNWAIYFIGRYPDVQRKIHEELDEIYDGDDRPASSDDLRNMKYLECVIKESLRLYPSVPIFGRKLMDDLDLDGIIIPKDTNIYVLAPFVHRDPQHFPDPLTFNPDRFLLENATGRHPYSYVPFSAGPRNCIGQKFALMEEKVVLSSILRRFQIEAIQTEAELHPTAELILRAESVQVKLTHRSLC
ncbi:cytochrome P450 4c3-like [Tubulanus polymorphus]|uniref:cytochrome P450 4c3-like n=1 Tax=Tubulanus polymorphus TaxID=672921 RepID=UPI003DA32B3F